MARKIALLTLILLTGCSGSPTPDQPQVVRGKQQKNEYLILLDDGWMLVSKDEYDLIQPGEKYPKH